MTDEATNERGEADGGDVLRRWRSLLVPAAIAAGALVLYALVSSFRGAGPAALDLLASADGRGTLDQPHPLFGLVVSLADTLGAGPPLDLLRLVSLTCIVGSLPAVWGIGRKLGGIGTAAAAATLFAILPQTAGLATSITAGSLFVFLWSWFLRLLVVDRHNWATGLGLWLVGGALVLVWPVVLLWGAIWLFIEIREGRSPADETGLPGEIEPGAVPIAVILAPIGVLLVATLLHPELLSTPIDGWRRVLQSATSWTGPVFNFAGVAYRHARPPLWMGLTLFWWSMPALVVVASAFGWLRRWRAGDADSRPARLATNIVLWAPVLALLLPWLHRGPAFGRIEFTYVLLPVVSLLTGDVVAAGFRSLRTLAEEKLGSRPGRAVAAVASAAALLSVLGVTLRSHPVEGSYYNRLAGGFGGAVEQGLRVSRDGVFPISVLRRATATVGDGSLHIVDSEEAIGMYEKAGLLAGVSVADDAFSADAFVRRLGTFEPGSEAVRDDRSALVHVGPGTVPVLEIDGIPVVWLERHTTP